MCLVESQVTSTNENAMDPAVQAFAERMMRCYNDAALALMISIGHRTRLFDRMAEMDPATSQEIADATGLSERYVREWLGALTTGGITQHNPATNRYWLPAERAALLTRAATPNNMAAVAQFFAVLGGAEDKDSSGPLPSTGREQSSTGDAKSPVRRAVVRRAATREG